MKHYKKVLFLSSIALAFFSAMLAFLSSVGAGPEIQPAIIHEINSLSVSEISAVAIKNATGSYGFILGQDGYISVVPERATGKEDYSQEELRAFVFLLSKLSASAAVDSGATAAEFGLDQPLARISLILKDSRTLRFSLGNQSPVDDSHYFQKDGDPRVYVIGKTAASLMLRDRLDFWNKELLPGVSTESLDLLRGIRLSSAGQVSRNWALRHTGDFTFQLTEPVVLNIKTDNAFSKIILPISTLRPEQFLGLSGDLAAYGLDKPDYTLTVTHGDAAQVLLFSHDGNGGFHASRKDIPGIFRIPEDRLQFLSLGYRELIGDYVYNGSMASVDTIEYSRPSAGISYRLVLFGEGAELYGIMDGRSIPYKQASSAVTPIYEIGIVGEVGSKGNLSNEMRKALERPAHTAVKITKRNGTMDMLEFLSLDEKLSFVRINGKISFTAYTHAARAIEDALTKLTKRNHER